MFKSELSLVTIRKFSFMNFSPCVFTNLIHSYNVEIINNILIFDTKKNKIIETDKINPSRRRKFSCQLSSY